MMSSSRKRKGRIFKTETIIKRSRAQVWRSEGVQNMDNLIRNFIRDYEEYGLQKEKMFEFGKKFMEEKKIVGSSLIFHKFHNVTYKIAKECAKFGGYYQEMANLIFQKTCCVIFKLGTNSECQDIESDKKMGSILNSIFQDCGFDFNNLLLKDICEEYKKKFSIKRPEEDVENNNTNKSCVKNVPTNNNDTWKVIKQECDSDITSIKSNITTKKNGYKGFEKIIKSEIVSIETKEPTKEKESETGMICDSTIEIFNETENRTLNESIDMDIDSSCGFQTAHSKVDNCLNVSRPDGFDSSSVSSTETDNDSFGGGNCNYTEDDSDIPQNIYGEFLKMKLDWLLCDFNNCFYLPSDKQKRLDVYLRSYLRYLTKRMILEHKTVFEVKKNIKNCVHSLYDFMITDGYKEELLDKMLGGYISPKTLSEYSGESFSQLRHFL